MERVIAIETITPTATAARRMRSIAFRAAPAAPSMTAVCACIDFWWLSAISSIPSARPRAASFTDPTAAFPSCGVVMDPARTASSTRWKPAA